MSQAPGILLCPPVAEDFDRLLAWRNQPEVARWMYSDHVITPEEHAQWCATVLRDPKRRYWIIELDGLPVGLANIYDLAAGDRKVSWAYYLADSAVRGRGVGAFVEFCIIEHVFGALGLNKLWCEVLLANEAVWKLHESFGFRREALFRAHVWKHGEPHDVVGLGLLATDWAAQRPISAARLQEKGFDLAALPSLA